jgi:hypothetical protein
LLRSLPAPAVPSTRLITVLVVTSTLTCAPPALITSVSPTRLLITPSTIVPAGVVVGGIVVVGGVVVVTGGLLVVVVLVGFALVLTMGGVLEEVEAGVDAGLFEQDIMIVVKRTIPMRKMDFSNA